MLSVNFTQEWISLLTFKGGFEIIRAVYGGSVHIMHVAEDIASFVK